MAIRTLCLRVANPIGLDPDQTNEKKNRLQIDPPGSDFLEKNTRPPRKDPDLT